MNRGGMHHGMPGTSAQEEPRIWRLPGGLAFLANILIAAVSTVRAGILNVVPGSRMFPDFSIINATRA